MRIATLALILLGIVGCAAPKSESLLGHDEAYVVTTLGKPDSRRIWVEPGPGQPPWFGPHPSGLLPGEPFVSLFYPSVSGEQWTVFLASPAIFERVLGRKPEVGESDCVFDVQKAPKGAVY
jgi:hypothetical protein